MDSWFQQKLLVILICVCMSPGNKVMDYYGIPRWRISLGFGTHDCLILSLCNFFSRSIESICWGITNLKKMSFYNVFRKRNGLLKLLANLK